MKFVLIICIVALAGILGYLAEPTLRPIMTGQTAGGEDTGQPDADVIVIETPDVDPHAYAPEQLPETVIITYPARFVIESSKLSLDMPVGSIVKLVRLDGDRVIVSPEGTTYQVPMAINRTDLLAQLAGITPIPPSERKAPEPVAVADNTTPPAPPSTGDTEEPADTTDVEVADNTTPDSSEEPAEEPEAEDNGPLQPVSDNDLLTLMKNSILNGQIKEFNFDQVKTWTKGDNETVDNVEFQTGNVTYETETLFGKKTIEARAYVRNGNVVRWVWPKSGIELE